MLIGIHNSIVETIPTVAFIRKNFNRMQFKVNHNNKMMNAIIFNRAFMKRNITVGKTITLVGKYDNKRNTFTCDDIKLTPITKKEIIPIYHINKNIKNNEVRKIIETALNENVNINNYVPLEFAQKYNFISKNQAIRMIHNPHNYEELKQANIYLKYEELFLFLFKINYMKKENIKKG